MRHRNAGFKLGRNTSHRRATLRNLVTSIITMDRIETTITKAKASKPLVERMITLGKRGDVQDGDQPGAQPPAQTGGRGRAGGKDGLLDRHGQSRLIMPASISSRLNRRASAPSAQR